MNVLRTIGFGGLGVCVIVWFYTVYLICWIRKARIKLRKDSPPSVLSHPTLYRSFIYKPGVEFARIQKTGFQVSYFFSWVCFVAWGVYTICFSLSNSIRGIQVDPTVAIAYLHATVYLVMIALQVLLSRILTGYYSEINAVPILWFVCYLISYLLWAVCVDWPGTVYEYFLFLGINAALLIVINIVCSNIGERYQLIG